MTGKNLKDLLKRRGMRQRRFADLAGVSESFLSNFIHGRIRFDDRDDRLQRIGAVYELLKRLGAAVGVSTECVEAVK